MMELTSENFRRSRKGDSVFLRSQQLVTLLLGKAISSWMGVGEMVNTFTMMFPLLIFNFMKYLAGFNNHSLNFFC
jgi:hypothetical protein